MKRFGLFLLSVLLLTACSKKDCLTSPDGRMEVSFRLTESGQPQYSVTKDGDTIIYWSALGLKTQEINLDADFRKGKTEFCSYDDQWETVWGEERIISDKHNQMTIHLHHHSGIKMGIVFRAFDDGFAFRYTLENGDHPLHPLTITDEVSEYRFASDHEAWSIPWRTEYYEGLWTKAKLSEKQDTLCSPITLERTDGGYAFVNEAALTDYPAQNLYMQNGALKTYLTPWLEEGKSTNTKAYIEMPFSTPWRMVIWTDDLQQMVASRIMLNLNEPCKIEDTSWIKPMKFIGIWWGMHIKLMTWEEGPKHGATTANMEKYLRFAKEHGIEGVLAEGWNKGWKTWADFSFTEPYEDWNMDYLASLADSLGVQIIGHNETGGNAAYYESVLDEAYAYHHDHGIHAIKTGYVAPIIRTIDGLQWNKGQSGVRHYRKVIETAARYQIAIDNHEPVMPTGLQRTYPNLMSQEGVRGQEWNAWSDDGGNPCSHVTILPFTRIMAGPVDFTPGVFHFENPGNAIDPTGVRGSATSRTPRVHSTLMNQLGLFVCFYSPLQMACDLPEHYMEHPDAFRFIEHVPCNWERSILVDGQIGEFCVFARQERGTQNWYIGGINAEEEREVTIPLSMLEKGKNYQATIWRDGEKAHWENNPYEYVIEEKEVTSEDTLRIRMASGGGLAVEVKGEN